MPPHDLGQAGLFCPHESLVKKGAPSQFRRLACKQGWDSVKQSCTIMFLVSTARMAVSCAVPKGSEVGHD